MRFAPLLLLVLALPVADDAAAASPKAAPPAPAPASASAARDPEAVRLVEAAAGHFAAAALVQADVVLEEGRIRLLREDGVGVAFRAEGRQVLVRGDALWWRRGDADAWEAQKRPPSDARDALEAFDRESVPVTAEALRARLADATAVRLAGPLPDEAGCAVRGVLIDQGAALRYLALQLELRVCADDGRPVGARMRRPNDGSRRPHEDATYTLLAEGALPDPAAD